MRDFVYNIPTKVYFGKDQFSHLGEEVRSFGDKVLLTYGGGSIKRSGLYDRVMEELRKAGMQVWELSGIEPNPRHTSVQKGADICKEHDIDVILAVGGGSVIDASKYMAAGRYYDGDVWDFHGKMIPIEKAMPIVTVLTIAATGSEMDGTGVITNMDLHIKKGRAHPLLYPKVSFLDPTLTYSVSKYQTACGAADIFSHTQETYFAREDGMYFLDTVMEGLMRTVIKYSTVALKEPDNYEARANLMWASSWGINGFVRADKPFPWSCHPLEHELSAFYDITHGLGLAILTPRWMRHVLSEKTLGRFVKYAVNVWGVDESLPEWEIAEKGIECTEKWLYEDLGLTDNLTALGINEEHLETMAERVGGKIHKGFVDLSKEDCLAIYKACL
ncbi:MAG: iron-containing alcohol dehydrogenase [Erysipelotrichales bacterium]|nr:iron-containing alcohol dehydrogenase [Erysipelotrichales bacterium]